MKIIKCIAEKVEEELHDADAYIELAMKWKSEEPDTADLFYELSVEEMGHVEKLHEEVKELIEEYRKEHGEPPKDMMVLYDYLHEKHIAEATHIKVKQGIYKA
jgi:rubrerythrin